MLATFRNNRKSISGLLIAGFVAMLMIGFGVDISGGRRGGTNNSLTETAIKIADKEISFETYYQRLNQVSEMARYQLKDDFPKMKAFLNLEQRTVDEIINEFLLKDFVKKLGLSASTPQVEEYIQNLPFFKKFGFNQQTYTAFLNAQGLSGVSLEQETRNALANKQLLDFLTDADTPSYQELKAINLAKDTQYEFIYTTFKASNFEANIDTKDESKLKAYYDLNKASYQKPRTVKYSFVKFNPEEFKEKVDINEDELQAMYEENRASYYEPKELNLRKIVIKKAQKEASELEKLVSPETAKEAESSQEKRNEGRKESAKKIVERLKNKEDFAVLAKELSEDRNSAENGGSLGWIKGNTLEKEIRPVAERMEKGKFSDVIETENAFVILFLDDLKDKRLRPFSEVRAELEQRRRTEDAPEYAKAEADNFLKKYQEQDPASKLSFEEFAKKEKFSAQSTGNLMNGSENPPAALGLTAKIISLPQGTAQVVKLPDSLYAVEISETKDSYIPEYDLIKSEVIKDYVKEKSQELAKEAAEKFLTEAKNKDLKAFEQLASTASLEIKNTAPAKRSNLPENEPLFSNPEILKVAFNLSAENPYPPTTLHGNNEYFVMRLKNKILPEEKDVTAKIKETLKDQTTSSGNRFLTYVLHVLKIENDTWVNPKILEKTDNDIDFEI